MKSFLSHLNNKAAAILKNSMLVFFVVCSCVNGRTAAGGGDLRIPIAKQIEHLESAQTIWKQTIADFEESSKKNPLTNEEIIRLNRAKKQLATIQQEIKSLLGRTAMKTKKSWEIHELRKKYPSKEKAEERIKELEKKIVEGVTFQEKIFQDVISDLRATLKEKPDDEDKKQRLAQLEDQLKKLNTQKDELLYPQMLSQAKILLNVISDLKSHLKKNPTDQDARNRLSHANRTFKEIMNAFDAAQAQAQSYLSPKEKRELDFLRKFVTSK